MRGLRASNNVASSVLATLLVRNERSLLSVLRRKTIVGCEQLFSFLCIPFVELLINHRELGRNRFCHHFMASTQILPRLFVEFPLDIERIVCSHLHLLDWQKAAPTSHAFHSRFILEISRFFGTWRLGEPSLEDCKKRHTHGCHRISFYTLYADRTFTGHYATHHFVSPRDWSQFDGVMSGRWKLNVSKDGQLSSVKVLLEGKAVWDTTPAFTINGFVTQSREHRFSDGFYPYGRESKFRRSCIPPGSLL